MISGLNIVVLPSEEIAVQSIVWSKTMAQTVPTKFILDNATYFPHMTVYQSNFPDEYHDEIKSKLLKLSHTFKPFPVVFERIDTYVDFIFYYARPNPTLQAFHEVVLETISPLHDPNMSPPRDLDGFPSHIAENIQQYGTALAKNDYLPHITLSRCSSPEDAKKAVQSVVVKELTMNITALHLTNVDHDGTCTNILQKFSIV